MGMHESTSPAPSAPGLRLLREPMAVSDSITSCGGIHPAQASPLSGDVCEGELLTSNKRYGILPLKLGFLAFCCVVSHWNAVALFLWFLVAPPCIHPIADCQGLETHDGRTRPWGNFLIHLFAGTHGLAIAGVLLLLLLSLLCSRTLKH